jgi:hypothetical protein
MDEWTNGWMDEKLRKMVLQRIQRECQLIGMK